MEYILNIHTATETAILSLCDGQHVLCSLKNEEPKQHAAFLHTAIQKILKQHKVQINELKAIGVTNGPGSYTGIRVGLATAKGLCYALKIPMITFNTLEVLTLSAIDKVENEDIFYCPMLDARRMEVYTAVYTYHLKEILSPQAMILTENSFSGLTNNQIAFFGNGSEKFKAFSQNKNEIFLYCNEISDKSLAFISASKYQQKIFADVAYSEALYLKDFHTTVK